MCVLKCKAIVQFSRLKILKFTVPLLENTSFHGYWSEQVATTAALDSETGRVSLLTSILTIWTKT